MTDQAKAARTATLTLGDKTVELPVLSGSTGPDVIDIRKLYGATDAFTYDPGFTSTAACESALTFIDGDVGTLLHRGYPIDQLASQSNFIEVCHLLLHGELPTAAEYEPFERSITMHTMLHSQFDRFFERGAPIYRGYVDDPRNTDNAWVETQVRSFHDHSDAVFRNFDLKAGDDATNVAWLDVDDGLQLYATHKDFIHMVAQRYIF